MVWCEVANKVNELGLIYNECGGGGGGRNVCVWSVWEELIYLQVISATFTVFKLIPTLLNTFFPSLNFTFYFWPTLGVFFDRKTYNVPYYITLILYKCTTMVLLLCKLKIWIFFFKTNDSAHLGIKRLYLSVQSVCLLTLLTILNSFIICNP